MKKKRFFKLMRAYNCRTGLLNKELNCTLRDYHSIKPPASYANIWELFYSPILGVGVKKNQKGQP